ncbi:MAG: hypothetical protein WAS73_01925 [Defluviicoccus sp.]
MPASLSDKLATIVEEKVSMIHLALKREPHWLDLGRGVRVHVRPCTTALMMAARAEVNRPGFAGGSNS